MKPNGCTYKLVGFLLFGITAFPLTALGQCADSYDWVATSGNWLTPDNWRHQEWDPELQECVWVPGVPGGNNQVIIRNGGTAIVTEIANAGPIDIESSQLFIIGTDGSLTANGHIVAYLGGQITLGNGSLSAQREQIGVRGTGSFTQNGGTNMAGDYIIVGNLPDSSGRYELNGGELSAGDVVIGASGVGTLFHNAGTLEIIEYGLGLGQEVGSEGTYILNEGAQLETPMIGIGEAGTGTFIQYGGTNTVTDYIILGNEFMSEGTYGLLGGSLDVGRIIVGWDGTGSFVVDAGTINGTTDDSELRVCGSKGSLTGSGTFNIKVYYESDEIYGTNGNECVVAVFERNCLMEAGAYSVQQITPTEFAGGVVPNLLESSVFDVAFDGLHCGQFEIGIPYNQVELDALGFNENCLRILHETGPQTYEELEITQIDTFDDVIGGRCDSFGKFALSSSNSKIKITKARMVSANELGIDLKLTVPKSDPVEGPRMVRFTAEINGMSFTTREFDLTRLLDPGDTNKEIRFDAGLDPRRINLEEYEIPRFSANQLFELTAVFSASGCEVEGTEKVEILLPVIIIHGWKGEHLIASIPLRIYESLKDRLKDEGYTTDDSSYKTIWYDRYSSQTMSPREVSNWLDNIVIEAINSTYAKRVNIIGHSLGGLVGRYYVTDHGGEDKVHKLIMIGTPNKGSSKFYINTSRWSIERVKRKLDKSPLAQWLIPTYTYPALYDPNHSILPSPISNNFPDFLPGEDVTYYSIYNTAIDTPNKLIVEPYRGWFEVIDTEYYESEDEREGDGVVPRNSSRLDGIDNRPLVIPSCGHVFLTKDPDVQNEIIECLED